jgi:hypothetical protein
MSMLIAKRKSLYDAAISDNNNDNKSSLSDHIILPSYYLTKLIEQYPDNSGMYIATITNTTRSSENTYTVSIGIPHFADKLSAFVPDWILNIIGITTEDDIPIKITPYLEPIPLIKKVVIKPLDSLVFNIDIVSCFEKALMNLTILTEGVTIPITIPELGYHEAFAYIEKVEPLPISLVHSADIEVDFNREYEEHNYIPNDQVPNVHINKTINNAINESVQHNTTVSNEVVSEPNVLSPEERRKRIRESWAKKYS